MGTLQNLVSGERKRRRIEESDIVFNDGKAKKTRTTFDEKGWNDAYKQACDDLTPEELEACQYVASNLLTPEEFAAL